MSNRVSNDQLEALLEFLAEHPALAKGVGLGTRSKEAVDKLWNGLALKLNAFGSGSTKSGERWKKYWSDIKHKSKTRFMRARLDASGTGGELSSPEDLSEIDKKILAIIGKQFGEIEHRVPVFDYHPENSDEASSSYILPHNSIKIRQPGDTEDSNIPNLVPQTFTINFSDGTIQEPLQIQDIGTAMEPIESLPSHTGASPVSRPTGERRRHRRNLHRNAPSRMNRQWLELERSRAETERTTAEAQRTIANAAMIMAEAFRGLVDVMHQQDSRMNILLQKREPTDSGE